ncbi:Phenazine biosynthesis protein PhzF like [hydrothermal vent metagenome]|uniref:Phenazine biosynthesis protein PhzF like n=1 Tax=hydrothermal vent metagenome TaxID=652676 RepID=A0A3B0UGH1_9ZZZZ
MYLEYFLLDVFTDRQLSGNQLAVVLKADYLGGEVMQKIAHEFNLSETVFLGEPEVGRHTARARIFTPKEELPFAGHPTIGAAVLLGLQTRSTAIRLEEKIGLITCVMERVSKTIGEAHFKLPKLPVKTKSPPENEAIARALGIKEEQIGCENYLPSCYSSGLEYTLIPVKNRDVLANLKLERRGWAQSFGCHDSAIYVFTTTPENRQSDFAARMFQPTLPGGEDVATGSAAAALIGLIAEKSASKNGQKRYLLHQGEEMGRPSMIEMQVGMTEGVLTHAGIGGKAVIFAQGRFELSADFLKAHEGQKPGA